MAADVNVEIVGMRDVRRALRRIEDAATAKGMHTELRGVFQRAADAVADEARREAPRRSGRLAGSIKGKATTTGAWISAGGAGVPYAKPIHWGWPSRPNRRKGWRGGPIAANRFLTRAAEKSNDKVFGILERGLSDFVDRVESS